MKSIAIVALTLLVVLPATAQSSGKKKPAAKTVGPPKTAVTLVQVNDRRGESFAKLSITADLPVVKQAVVAASRVLVRRAVDDTGRDLMPEEQKELESSSGAMFGRRSDEPAPARITIELKNPARAAHSVSEIAGEIELYMPSNDPKSVTLIKSFLSKPGKAITNAGLKSNGIEIIPYDSAQFDAEKKRLAEKKRKEAVKDGMSGEFLESFVENFLDLFLTPSEGDVILKVTDPNKKIQEIVLLDPSGEVKRGSSYERDGMTVLSTWGETPGPDWSLRIGLKTQKSFVRYSFAMKDVPLP